MFNTGSELRAARRDAGMTQADLATVLGIYQSYVATLESRSVLPLKMRRRLAAIFGTIVPIAAPPVYVPAAESGRGYQRLDPAEKARNHFEAQAEARRLKGIVTRNRLRATARGWIAGKHFELVALATACQASGDWLPYSQRLAMLILNIENPYISDYLMQMKGEVLAADNALVALPDEPLAKTAAP